jgi:hypothetical protein
MSCGASVLRYLTGRRRVVLIATLLVGLWFLNRRRASLVDPYAEVEAEHRPAENSVIRSTQHVKLIQQAGRARAVVKMPCIAICAPTHSLSSWVNLSDTSLQTLLIPSIESTVTAGERQIWDIRLYLGIDHNDTFWRAKVRELVAPAWLKVKPGFYPGPAHRIPMNEMTRDAYIDGAEYIARVNDDSEFKTSGWISAAVQTLRHRKHPNVGVVGPTMLDCRNRCNQFILTHDFVHRTHLEIFEDYYPGVFDNWFVDDWITRVYQPSHLSVLGTWGVKHHTSAHTSQSKRTRYEPQHFQERYLTPEVHKGRQRIAKFIGENFPAQPVQYCNRKKPCDWAQDVAPCCSNLGFCGASEKYCLCPDCVDYSLSTMPKPPRRKKGLKGQITSFFGR